MRSLITMQVSRALKAKLNFNIIVMEDVKGNIVKNLKKHAVDVVPALALIK